MVLPLDHERGMNILLAITLAALLHRAPAPVVMCHPGTVSYRFLGPPGTRFTYEGTTYSLPPSGWIELIREGEESVYLAADGRKLPLDCWPIDAFGTRTVPVQEVSGMK